MIGGFGADVIKGENDDDILVANSLTFEDDPAALQAILTEWTSSRSFAQRIANLKSTGTGPKANGTYLLNSSSLIDDNAVDTLFGSSGSDWFLGTAGEDLFKDRKKKDQQN